MPGMAASFDVSDGDVMLHMEEIEYGCHSDVTGNGNPLRSMGL
jgi:hypothetical protein